MKERDKRKEGERGGEENSYEPKQERMCSHLGSSRVNTDMVFSLTSFSEWLGCLSFHSYHRSQNAQDVSSAFQLVLCLHMYISLSRWSLLH